MWKDHKTSFNEYIEIQYKYETDYAVLFHVCIEFLFHYTRRMRFYDLSTRLFDILLNVFKHLTIESNSFLVVV